MRGDRLEETTSLPIATSGVGRAEAPHRPRRRNRQEIEAEEENMADSRSDVDAGDDSGPGVRRGSGKTGLAFWQKVVAILGLLVLLVIVIVLVVGGGHTPPVQHGAG